MTRFVTKLLAGASVLAVAAVLTATPAVAQEEPAPAKPTAPKPRPEFPPHKEVLKDFEKVVSTADGARPLFNLYINKKDGNSYAELPGNFASQKYFFAMTVGSGETYAGLQAGDMYVYWRRYDKRLALIQPELSRRSTGDRESKSSVERLFTDRVLLDVPIVTMGPSGGPVIDLDNLLVNNAQRFFGGSASGVNSRLASLEKAKAFPENVEIAYEVPTSGGVLKNLYYSISRVPEKGSYKPRTADERIGYFTTEYTDLGKYKRDDVETRFINRWDIQKADPKLKLSPPKEPLVFYIEHTTPVRYRRFVRDGVLSWNKAFRKVGIDDAIIVHYQDAATGAHMDKDPEDVRYNFVRWLNNNIGTAIGPSRVHPMTGQILDADIILTDGWIRSFERDFSKILPKAAMESFGPNTLAWLEQNPAWDPRILLASPHQRATILHERAMAGPQPFGGHPIANLQTELLGDDEFDGLVNRVSQVNGYCMAADARGFDLAMLKMTMAMIDDEKDDEKKDGEEEKSEEDMLDGMPASFIGPLLADLVAHEAGHTLGLRHNFRASGLYTLDEINSDKVKGKPFTASVMDYNPLNVNMEDGKIQGDFAMIDIGPYDEWAIEYGYTQDEKALEGILAQCTQPEHQYATDEDTSGPDPLARRYDFAADPLDFAKSQVELAHWHRDRILDRFVKKGDSWSKAREGYSITLSMQTRAVSMMGNWLGGSFLHRRKKGDGDDVAPVIPVPASQQRAALDFIIEETFDDDSFGLTTELLQHMTSSKWGYQAASADWQVHDTVMGLQASALTMIMNPTTLRRVYDNEVRAGKGQDVFSLPELMEKVRGAIWKELDSHAGTMSANEPMISNLRRGLQRQHVYRLIDLTEPGEFAGAASLAISTLALQHIRELHEKIDSMSLDSLDAYTKAHLNDIKTRLEKALAVQYTMPVGGGGNSLGGMIFR
ncbi:MAG: zinc-dependent metalloprotease [Planctomycetota bacterium]